VATVTLQTIADRLGVSRMTVSNAFSRPDQLSSQLRERILATADELGYAGPDPAARALSRGSSGAVGVLLTDRLHEAFTDEIATAFLAAIVDELAPTGLALTLLTAAEHHGPTIPARDVAIDGALVYSCLPESEARNWLLKRHLPLVFVDQDPAPGITSVNVDDRGGARAAAQHLIDLGHRRIGLLTAATHGEAGELVDPITQARSHPQRERLLGWLDALDAADLEPTVVAQLVGHTENAVADVARLVLDRPDRPTAVLCFSDVLALGLMHQAAARGLEVPRDLSVVGFDDSPLSRLSQPTITTVRQDVAAKGREAASALVAAIAAARAGTKPRARRINLPAELVIRDSTAPPPSPT
jgi:DNA-binding LacI/PurR family transcriptional regulator